MNRWSFQVVKTIILHESNEIRSRSQTSIQESRNIHTLDAEFYNSAECITPNIQQHTCIPFQDAL